MKISEIVTVHSSEFNFAAISRDNEQKFGFNGKIGPYDMFKNRQDSLIVYYLVDNDNIIAAIVGQEIGDYIQIKRTFAELKYRGQKIAYNMYHSIIYNELKNLMSDTEQTSDGKKIWNDLSKIIPVKSYNFKTKQVGDKSLAYDETHDTVLITDAPQLTENLLIPNLKITEHDL